MSAESPILDKRAKICLSANDIVNLLNLPDGILVRAVRERFDPPGIDIIVCADTLPEVAPDTESPYLDGTWTRQTIIGPDNSVYARWDWEQDGA